MAISLYVSVLAFSASVRAHTGFWAPGMYCKGVRNSVSYCSFESSFPRDAVRRSDRSLILFDIISMQGNTGTDDQNSNAIVQPLYQLPFNQWWSKSLSPYHSLTKRPC